jgi:hypothetical protein
MWHRDKSDTEWALDSSIFELFAQVSAKMVASESLGTESFRGGSSPTTVKGNGIAS